MKGIDCNVLVRLLVADDAGQAERAHRYVADNAPCWVNRVVLCETVWVLQRAYGLGAGRIALALRQLLDTAQFEVEDPGTVRAAIPAMESGFDFADVVIATANRHAGCEATGTFDRKAARLDGFEPV